MEWYGANGLGDAVAADQSDVETSSVKKTPDGAIVTFVVTAVTLPDPESRGPR